MKRRFYSTGTTRLLSVGLALVSSTACLELETSDLDTANGGTLGLLLTIVGSEALNSTTTYYAFTDSTTFFTSSSSDSTWTAQTASGVTTRLNEVVQGSGQTLWGIDGAASDNLVRSDDQGATWTSVAVTAQTFATLNRCDSTIYMTFKNIGNFGVAYSNDDGGSWNIGTITALSAGFTVEDADCSDNLNLAAMPNEGSPVLSSINGGAGWGSGTALANTSPRTLAIERGTLNMLHVYAVGGAPESRLSTDLGATYQPADTATWAGSTYNGAVARGSDSYYVGMRAGTDCRIYFSATGASGSFSMRSGSCTAISELSAVVHSGDTVLYGGTNAFSPLLFRWDRSTDTVVQETLPAGGSTITHLLAVPD